MSIRHNLLFWNFNCNFAILKQITQKKQANKKTKQKKQHEFSTGELSSSLRGK